MEEEKENSTAHRRGRQPISVPFLWEEKPGTPKIEWTMSRSAPLITYPSPARLIVSVPFQWEEKPGKPFPHSSQPSADPISVSFFPALVSSPDPFIGEEEHQLFQESSSEDGSNHHDDWCSVSETVCHSSSSSSATRNASIDASALEFLLPFPSPDAGLEFLFPLSNPNAGFLHKVSGQDNVDPADSEKMLSKKSSRGDRGLMVKRTLTLGELILLSRKLSYRRKPTDMKKKRFSMEFIRKSLLACFPLRTSCDENTASITSS